MKILFLTNLLPYPLDNGGKIKTYTTLKALSDAGHDVDLLCFKETQALMDKEEAKLLEICHSVKQVYLPLTTADHKNYMIKMVAKSLFSILPFSVYKYQSTMMDQELSEKQSIEFDIVYFDHLPMCVYLDTAQRMWPKAKFILDEHNCEATITKRKANETRNYLKKVFFGLEASKLTRFEKNSIMRVDKTIVLSVNDYSCLRQMTSSNFCHSIIPIGVPDKGIKSDNGNSTLNILFVGTLTWEPNNDGLIWFLKEVIPLMNKSKISFHLYIVGKNPSHEIKKLGDIYQDNVTITGYVESVDEYYDLCDCTIVPLFIGSGQRVKLIEAFSKGMPAISTTIGAEGLVYTDKHDILIADNPEDFARALVSINNRNIRDMLGRNSREVYEKHYSPETIEKRIKESIEFGSAN